MALKDLRQQARLTQKELARKLDVDQATVSYWESGKTRPAAKHRRKLCKLFRCKEDEL